MFDVDLIERLEALPPLKISQGCIYIYTNPDVGMIIDVQRFKWVAQPPPKNYMYMIFDTQKNSMYRRWILVNGL